MAFIQKVSGERARFNQGKLRQSLRRAGAEAGLADEVVKEVARAVRNGMTTHHIHKMALRMLKRRSRPIAAKFHLKRAMLHLGQSGFPFERYVAELLRQQNMRVDINRIMAGKCVHHEIDIVAIDDDKVIVVECKYHNSLALKTDLKVALSVKARFDDLKRGAHLNGIDARRSSAWLVTNTRFSTDAEKFGLCAGLRLMAWDFPKKGSLRQLIESAGLYPVTCLTNLTRSEIASLLADNIVLCRTIRQDPQILDRLAIPLRRKRSILDQCDHLTRQNQQVS